MSFQDKSIQCSDCKAAFTFSTSEPKRCPSCRAKRKMERYGDGDHNHRSRSWK